MYLGIYIIIALAVALVIFILIKRNHVSREHNIIKNDKGKNTQFNPEKVSGLMPNEKLDDAKNNEEDKP